MLAQNSNHLKSLILKQSPYFLGKEVLGFSKFCETQKEWEQELKEQFKFKPQNKSYALKLYPRETLKSTFFVVTTAITALLQNPDLTILIASETQTNANAHLKEIKDKIESEPFKKIFGNIKADSCWRDDAIELTTRKYKTKEANIETAGIGKSLTGKHYDFVIMDDIAGSDDRDSSAKRKETYNFFNAMFDVLKKETGQLLVVGTRWHRQDIYNHIMKNVAVDMAKKKLGTFHVSVKPAHDPKTGKLNFPRLLSAKKLELLKTVKQGQNGIDISTYMSQYELNPLSPEEQIFKTFHYTDVSLNQYESFSLWTDPALSTKSSACFSAIVVLAKLKDSMIQDVIYASLDKRNPTKLMFDHNRIFRLVRDTFNISGSAYMEENGFQLLVKQGATEQSINEQDIIPTVGRISTTNKLARIKSLEPFVSQGFLRFRHDYLTAPENYHLILEQFQNFPMGEIDGPDATERCYNETKNTISFRSL